MRILFVLHQFFPEFSSGTENATINLAKTAQRAGHHVEVLSSFTDATKLPASRASCIADALEYVHDGVLVNTTPENPNGVYGLGRGAARAGVVSDIESFISKRDFDIVHFTHFMRANEAWLAVRNLNVPYIVTCTDFFLPCPRINLIRPNGKLCAGPAAGENCVRFCGITSDSLDTRARFRTASDILTHARERVCPSAFVADTYRAIFPQLAFRSIAHGVDLLKLIRSAVQPAHGGKIVFGFGGTINPAKGLDVLLKAFADVRSDEVELHVIGDVHHSEAYRRIVVGQIDADRRVFWTRAVEQTEFFKRLAGFSVLCLPSQVPETFSLVLHEAAALQVPAFVSDLGAPMEIVRTSNAGMVLPHDQPEAWTRAIEEVARRPEQLTEWRKAVRIPSRIEEEGFFYEQLYLAHVAAPTPRPASVEITHHHAFGGVDPV